MSQLYSQPPRKPGFDEFERTFQLQSNSYYRSLGYDEKRAYQRGMIDMMSTIQGSGFKSSAPAIPGMIATPSPSPPVGLTLPPFSGLPSNGSQLPSFASFQAPQRQTGQYSSSSSSTGSSFQAPRSLPPFTTSKSMPLTTGTGSQTMTKTVSSSQPTKPTKAAAPTGFSMQLSFVGMKYRGRHRFQPTDQISLLNDDNNQYDKNAIKVMVPKSGKLHHAAYVTKDDAVVLRQKWPSGLYSQGTLKYVNYSSTGDTVHYRITLPPT